MELSDATIILLRDDAQTFLCREALGESIQKIEAEKNTVAGTRPPFGGMLARKDTREKFESSMRSLLESEAGVRERLARLNAIETKLHPLVRQAVAEYLTQISPVYIRLLQLNGRLQDWERALQALPELLLGFARDVRSLRLAAKDATSVRSCMTELAAVREIASRLDLQARELLLLSQAIAEAASAGQVMGLVPPELPDFRYVAWVSSLASRTPAQAVEDASRVESGIRQFLAEGAEAALARFETSRGVYVQHCDNFLRAYWKRLRDYACEHYLKEVELDAALGQMFHDYVEMDIAQHQPSIVFDPLAGR